MVYFLPNCNPAFLLIIQLMVNERCRSSVYVAIINHVATQPILYSVDDVPGKLERKLYNRQFSENLIFLKWSIVNESHVTFVDHVSFSWYIFLRLHLPIVWDLVIESFFISLIFRYLRSKFIRFIILFSNLKNNTIYKSYTY